MAQENGESEDSEYQIDEKVEEELEEVSSEEEILGMYSNDGSKGEKVPIVNSWFPDGDEWQGKTTISAREARVLAMARNLPEAFEEIEHMEGFIDGLVTDLEKYLTSVDGVSREQQKSVLMSMFGTSSDSDATQNMLAATLASNEEDD